MRVSVTTPWSSQCRAVASPSRIRSPTRSTCRWTCGSRARADGSAVRALGCRCRARCPGVRRTGRFRARGGVSGATWRPGRDRRGRMAPGAIATGSTAPHPRGSRRSRACAVRVCRSVATWDTDFTASSPTAGPAPLTVQFHDASFDNFSNTATINSWSWGLRRRIARGFLLGKRLHRGAESDPHLPRAGHLHRYARYRRHASRHGNEDRLRFGLMMGCDPVPPGRL